MYFGLFVWADVLCEKMTLRQKVIASYAVFEWKVTWPVWSLTALDFIVTVYLSDVFATHLREVSLWLTVSILKLKFPLMKNLHGDFKYQDRDLELPCTFNIWRTIQNRTIRWFFCLFLRPKGFLSLQPFRLFSMCDTSFLGLKNSSN